MKAGLLRAEEGWGGGEVNAGTEGIVVGLGNAAAGTATGAGGTGGTIEVDARRPAGETLRFLSALVLTTSSPLSS